MYDLQFSQDCFMCARRTRFDHGYWMHGYVGNLRSADMPDEYLGPAEPNYARYLNTISADQLDQYKYNVKF